MTITVETLSKQFTWLKRDDLKKLTGKSNFTKSDTISLENVALFGNKDINNYVARQERDNFLTYFSGQELVNLSKTSGVTPQKPALQAKVQKYDGAFLLGVPKGPSIFSFGYKNQGVA